MSLSVEPVEKVPKHIFGGDAEKSDLIECTTINDLMFGKGQATPEISVKTAKVTFSTGSLGGRRQERDGNGRRKETDDQKSDCGINLCNRTIDSWVITGIKRNYRKPASHLTFPMCGFGSDEWVLALLETKSYIPLSELGPDHESWGMKDAGGGKLSILDKAKQHKAYAETGSFGNYLFKTSKNILDFNPQ